MCQQNCFRIVDKVEQFKLELAPPEFEKYTNDHFNVFIKEKNLIYNILIRTPVHSNMQQVKKFDESILQLLKKKLQKSLLAQDMLYEIIQKKNLNVMGPLGKLFQSLEQAKRGGEYSAVVLEDLLRFTQQSVLLVGQTKIAASCHRRVPYRKKKSAKNDEFFCQ